MENENIENLEQAQEQTQTTEVENENVVDLQPNDTNENEDNESELNADEQQDEQDDAAEQERIKQENAEHAKRRRKFEQKQKGANDDYTRGLLDALGRRNPYTGEPIESESDIEEYKIMQKIASEGGDPIMDFRKYVKKDSSARRERESKQANQQRDLDDFESKYPNKLQTLTQDKNFAKFARGKVGNMPLTEVYEEYESMRNFFMDEARKTYEQMNANANSTPNALQDNESVKPKSISEMSAEEFEKFKQDALDGKYKKS